MKIIIESIPQVDQRYATLGDWFYEGEILHIKVSEEAGPTAQFLIALHELVEVKLCEQRGITQKMVDDFDFTYEGFSEPGDHHLSPYRKEHRFAMMIEHLMAHEMGTLGYGRVE